MQGVTLTVSQLNDYVRRSLASDPILQQITLRGEISNFKMYSSGHWYFSLKDEQSRIDCVLFRQHTYGVRFHPKDGDKVLLSGTAGLYVQGGKYQFYADGMQQDGVGDLYRRFLELKDKLTAEGLFDASRKRPLPLLPRKVGIVTSDSGAVLHDIRTVAGRRFPGLPLVLRPAQVQGDGAAQDVADGIRRIACVPGIDVVIVGRGGGSMEDLWAFNEEVVVRAVAACPVPVISAVGHETDTTLCDYAADALLAAVEELQGRSLRAAQTVRLQAADRLHALEKRLLSCQPVHHVREMRLRAEALRQRLDAAQDRKLQLLQQQLKAVTEKLRTVGPQQALERGYAIALKDGKPVTGVRQASGEMTLLFRDGRALVRVLQSKEEDPFGNQEGKEL